MTFYFHKLGRRREQSEMLHDMLVGAKDGLKKTGAMYAAGISWNPMIKLLKFANDMGLIEQVEIPYHENYRGKRSALVWRTTEKGLAYAEGVHEVYKKLQEAKTYV